VILDRLGCLLGRPKTEVNTESALSVGVSVSEAAA
jgi:hypothetical protein